MRCVCVWLGAAWLERGLMDKRIGFGLYHSRGDRGVFDVCLCFGGGGVGSVGGVWVGGLDRVRSGVVVLCLCEA